MRCKMGKRMRCMFFFFLVLVAAEICLIGLLGYLIWEKSASIMTTRHCEEGLQEVFGLDAGTKLWFFHGTRTGEQGKVYKVFNKQGKDKFEDARALCEKHQMRLLTIESTAELDFISDTLLVYKQTTRGYSNVHFWTAGKKESG